MAFELVFKVTGISEHRQIYNLLVSFRKIVEEKLAKEISQGRIAGPFHELPFVNMHISPIGLYLKKR